MFVWLAAGLALCLMAGLALCRPTRRLGKWLLRLSARVGLFGGLCYVAGLAGFALGFNGWTCAVAALLGLPGMAMLLLANFIF